MAFSDKDIYEAVKHHLPTVNEYVQSHMKYLLMMK
jgi:hypothetical protein